MTGSVPVSAARIRDFVERWFALLSAHGPVAELIPYLSTGDLEMTFPERTLRSTADFREWYAAVGAAFTDQNHRLQQLEISAEGDLIQLGIVVIWTAVDTSDRSRIAKQATQAWVLHDDRNGGRLYIQKYFVVRMIDAQGQL